jgi:hypothetical protein
MIEHLRGIISSSKAGDKFGTFFSSLLSQQILSFSNPVTNFSPQCNPGSYTLKLADDFTYTDPVCII